MQGRFQGNVAVSRLPFRVFGMVLLAGMLSACGHMPGQDMADESGRPDLHTSSDEPVARQRARVRLELAVGYFEQGQTTIALDELKQAIAQDPAYADAFNLRGLIYMRLSDYRLAEDSFRRALSLKSKDPDVSHNLGWLLCQTGRWSESDGYFSQALASPLYGNKSKTFMTQGLCLMRAGKFSEAESTLARSYELDAGNPFTGYNLADLLFRRKDFRRAQFYIRRLNNSEFANAESLWLGIQVERKMDDKVAMMQLVAQLRNRFPQSKELGAYERGEFND